MKTILSLIRHAVTGLAGIGTYLATLGLVDPGSVDAANQFGSQLVEPLAGLLGLIAIVLVRIALAWLGKFFPGLSEKVTTFPGQGNNRGGAAGGPLLLAGVCTAAGLMGLGLPSCSGVVSDYAGTSPIPFRIGILGPDGTVSYSSKGGLAVELDLNRQDAKSAK